MAPVTQNHLSKPTDLMLQNATPLRKSAPWPPNISDEHVSCIAHATRNSSFQILLKCPTPAIVFGKATKPSRFAHFWQGVQSLAPVTRNGIGTSKSGPNIWCSLTFWLRNVLRATTACTFSTSQLPKVVREWCVLYMLTSRFASRHNGLHFFDITTSKSAPTLVCFVHFDLEMCFAPQRRATFHLSSDDMARRFSEPPFRPSGVTNHWPKKHSVSRLSYLFAHLHFLSSHSFSSLIFSLRLFSSLTLPASAFPSVHIVGSLTSKLPSTILGILIMGMYICTHRYTYIIIHIYIYTKVKPQFMGEWSFAFMENQQCFDHGIHVG